MLVEESETETYSKRFDMIVCIHGSKTFAPVIYAPSERAQSGVKGINTEMLLDYIYSTLGQETVALDNPPRPSCWWLIARASTTRRRSSRRSGRGVDMSCPS